MNNLTTLPQEWLDLVKEAMNSDITQEEFKEFLNRRSQELNNHKQH
ncbi:anti-repressor SinI family protein [Priestia megaterium]|nr:MULTISPECIES: anti-repressor SinI family protein [Priestia]MBY0213574.1 anti-repressor SinI family protein [Priestia aryabhattai]MCE4093113.1 anti-repressor SinI family protein [Priestia megaterium]MCM2979011.1 anti-repressor SinI family protein [Priestia aryabhattai]MED3821508.1 anti-repressor SinI family protein [Priestia aryabhattai]NGY94000.1 DNA-binding anti-repressor SinI [Priestia megaterium]